MDVFVDQEVRFWLNDPAEAPIVHRRNSYYRVTWITVCFRGNEVRRLHCSGIRVRKDGLLGKGWGNCYTSVDLDDEQPWIDLARSVLAS